MAVQRKSRKEAGRTWERQEGAETLGEGRLLGTREAELRICVHGKGSFRGVRRHSLQLSNY